MATATAQDDDLLIIADDSASDDNIEFSFDFGEDTPKKEEEKIEEIAKNEEAVKIEETPLKETSTEESATKSKIDLGVSFDTPAIDEVEEVKTQEVAETTDESFSFDIEGKSEVVQEETLEIAADDSSAGDHTSMNDILSGTIAKLISRKQVIATDTASKSQKEEGIKTQIKELQSQVKQLEVEMKTLDFESNKITANIAELENMKLDPVKKHNAKRVVKK